MAHPYWSGQLRISLVSFGIRLFPATEPKSEIHFHQLNRRTGERIRYSKVSSPQDTEGEQEPVQAADIVKGYEYRKGEYVTIEPQDIEALRIPSKKTLDVTQFVAVGEIDPAYFEKPYFVLPEDDAHAEAFAVVRKALMATKTLGLGKIAFGGREHLVAIGAADDGPGMMSYTLRYAEELRKPSAYFEEIKDVAIDSDQLALAKELIERKTAKFHPEKFKDEYEAALREMVEAKVKHAPLPKEAPAAKSAKVVSLMDALRRSVQSDEAARVPKKAAKKRAAKRGPVLVKGAKTTRKSA
ncbi:MAG TPA: Ku protein [Granulicella sp.]